MVGEPGAEFLVILFNQIIAYSNFMDEQKSQLSLSGKARRIPTTAQLISLFDFYAT